MTMACSVTRRRNMNIQIKAAAATPKKRLAAMARRWRVHHDGMEITSISAAERSNNSTVRGLARKTGLAKLDSSARQTPVSFSLLPLRKDKEVLGRRARKTES